MPHMNERVDIQRVGGTNAGSLLDLIDGLADYESLDRPTADARERLMSDAVSAQSPFEAYLAHIDGTPVGYAVLFTTYSTFAGRPVLYLEDIFVREEHRRTGVGGALFDFCLAEAKARGCARMEWSVLTWNEPAIAFYEKRGGRSLAADWLPYRIDL